MLAEDAIKAAITDYKTKQEAPAARVEQADQEMEREAAAGGGREGGRNPRSAFS